ncbi:MAG: hypothetical protein DMF82_07685 [Acidobacteria bacterium]|nr:MAG: hypothetical protein DMF82_07685 [Acidobacteriota bacterium]
MNRIVARFQDGRVLKGFTNDFIPAKDHFHLFVDEHAGTRPTDVHVPELKALFFVKSFEGDPQHHKSNDTPEGATLVGRRIRVVFKDGEVIVGTTQGYDRNRPGFFLVPVDPGSNNERCFVIAAAMKAVAFR